MSDDYKSLQKAYFAKCKAVDQLRCEAEKLCVALEACTTAVPYQTVSQGVREVWAIKALAAFREKYPKSIMDKLCSMDGKRARNKDQT